MVDPLIKVESVLGQEIQTRSLGQEASPLRRVPSQGGWEHKDVEWLCQVTSIRRIKLESGDSNLNGEKVAGTLAQVLVAFFQSRVMSSAIGFRVKSYERGGSDASQWLAKMLTTMFLQRAICFPLLMLLARSP